MTEFDHNLDGMADHLEDLEREQEQWSDDDDVWFVGTAVEYSVTPMPSLNRTNSGKRYATPKGTRVVPC